MNEELDEEPTTEEEEFVEPVDDVHEPEVLDIPVVESPSLTTLLDKAGGLLLLQVAEHDVLR